MPSAGEWWCKRTDNAFRDTSNHFFRFDAVQLDHELVAAEPGKAYGIAACLLDVCYGIRRAYALRKAAGHVFQKLVTDTVAERIVDPLEAIKVDEQYGKFLAVLLRPLDCSLEALAEKFAVR